jgi:hypothetical protein
MNSFRFLGYLGPRLSQLLGWTFEPTSLSDKLLPDPPKIPDTLYQKNLKITSNVLQYVPPPYTHAIQFPKLKG